MIAVLLAGAALMVHGDRLFIPATINGVAIEAVLDSAAEATILDDEFAARAGASRGKAVTARGSGGSATAQLVEGVKVETLGLTLPDVTVGVLDLDDIGKRLFGHRLDSIVGRELFDAARLSIDIEGGTIAPVERRAAPEGMSLPLTTQHGVEAVPITIEGHEVLAEFDLGNGSDMLIGKAFAERTGLLARAHESGQGGGIGGAVKRPIVTLAAVTIAGATFRDVRAAVDEQPNAADANIGVKLLRRFRIVTDFHERAVWLQPRSAPTR